MFRANIPRAKINSYHFRRKKRFSKLPKKIESSKNFPVKYEREKIPRSVVTRLIKLDNRLQALADFVPPGARVADIGSDHGYLAINLLKSQLVDFVIVTDKNPAPLDSARRNSELLDVDRSKIEFRLGDGLSILNPNEVDTICIAGMGGALIGEILSKSPEIVETTRRLILQPMNGMKPLRTWIYRAGWHISNEKLVEADRKIYTIIFAEPGESEIPTAIELQLGAVILQKYRRTKIFREYLHDRIRIMQRVVLDMSHSVFARNSHKYLELKENIEDLKTILHEDEENSPDEDFSLTDLPTMIPRDLHH